MVRRSERGRIYEMTFKKGKKHGKGRPVGGVSKLALRGAYVAL